MDRPFVGSGWRFPLLPDVSGRLGYVSGDENVEQSLRLLLMTSLGERAMRFDFGTNAADLVFAPGSHRSLRLLETSIREAVRDWEPRIDLLAVEAEVDPQIPERALVSVSYQVLA